MLGCQRCFHATPSRQNRWSPFVQPGMVEKGGETHAEDNLQITGNVHSHNFESNPTPLVRALRHICKPPGFNFYGPFRAVGDVHRFWDYAMSAACFAQLIEQL